MVDPELEEAFSRLTWKKIKKILMGIKNSRKYL
jgi:hypothetical protein